MVQLHQKLTLSHLATAFPPLQENDQLKQQVLLLKTQVEQASQHIGELEEKLAEVWDGFAGDGAKIVR